MKNIINELFPIELIDQLGEICDSFDITNNNDRADEMLSLLEYYGFEEEGCGTNRLGVTKQGYPYIIKIALDSRGIKDNRIEHILCMDPLLNDRITMTVEENGLILVADKINVIRLEDVSNYEDEINAILQDLSHNFILNDIGPYSKNWGITDEGKLLIYDYAYVSRIEDAEIKECDKCSGKLYYTEDLSRMRCGDCGKYFMLADIKGRHSYLDQLIEDGWVGDETIIRERYAVNNDVLDESNGWV